LTVALILAGGVGERLWPVSTAQRSKQFLPLTGNLPLIQETVNRVKGLAKLPNIFVITTREQLALSRETITELPDENIITEPARLNTGPALAYGAAYISGKTGLNEVIAVLPADHFVSDNEKFQQDLNKACMIAALKKEIVTIGVKPDRPETEYGYLSAGEQVGTAVFKGFRFEEKPSLNKAREYVAKGGYLWNTGIFVFRLKVFIEKLKTFSPELYQGYSDLRSAKDAEAIQDIYNRLPKISIDYSLMEKLPSFMIVSGSFGWDDLGTWRSLETIYPEDPQGNVNVGSAEFLDAANCVAYAEDMPVAAIGVKDLVIAVGKEGALICHKDRVKDVRQIVDRLKNRVNPDIFREYDIRGLAETELTPPVIFRIGQALGRLMQAKGFQRALVGGDIRLSTPVIRVNLVKGLTSVGISVVDIGTVTTPLFYFGLQQLDVDGGIMITGSHNPKEYNGLKLALGKTTICGSEIQKIRSLVEEGPSAAAAQKGEVTKFKISNDYLNMLTDKIKLGPRRLKVVADAGNGGAALYIEQFLQSLGVEVIPLFCEADGSFPNHHPDPVRRENLTQLIEMVQKHNADVGIAYDGDADRLGVVDDQGRIIWGDRLMVLFWREILAKHPAETALVEVKCSQALVDEITRLGGKPVFCKTGHSLIKAKMNELKLLFAGEMSGHMFFADEFYGFDDAFYATGRLLRILSHTERKLSELVSDIPIYHSTDETRIDCPDNRKFKVIEEIRKGALEEYPAITIDGVRIIYPEGWGLVRASNTQPVLVARCESTSSEGLEFITGDLRKRILRAGAMDFTWE